MRRIFELSVVLGLLVIFGTGCLERKVSQTEAVVVEQVQKTAGGAEPGAEVPEVPAEPAEPVVEVPAADDDDAAKVAAAIAAAKAKRLAAMDREAPIAVSLGLQADGAVIVEWKEGLNYSVKNEGSARDEAGATVVAKFGNGFDKFDVELELVVKLQGEEKLVVGGTYEAAVPFQVTLLGTGETSDKAEGLSGEAGSGPFEYEGPVPVFFEVLRTE